MSSQPTLFYFADPMCSWCYGFSDQVETIRTHFSDRFNFQLVMGGLRPYNTETMADLGTMLQHHWDAVERRSGKKFNYAILNNQSFVYDTEVPSRAVVLMRKLNPDREFDFFRRIQEAF